MGREDGGEGRGEGGTFLGGAGADADADRGGSGEVVQGVCCEEGVGYGVAVADLGGEGVGDGECGGHAKEGEDPGEEDKTRKENHVCGMGCWD